MSQLFCRALASPVGLLALCPSLLLVCCSPAHSLHTAHCQRPAPARRNANSPCMARGPNPDRFHRFAKGPE